MLSPDFQWIFPSAPPNVTSSRAFAAQNATANSTGFNKLPLYVNDAIKLEWEASSTGRQSEELIQYECGIIRTSPNGSRSHTGIGQSYVGPRPYIWTLEFLSTSGTSPIPSPSANASISPSPSLGPAEDICVFNYFNTTLQMLYLTTAFSIVNTTRQGQPYLFSVDDPFGSPYTPLSLQPARSKGTSTRLATILGSVLGCLALLVVVVAFVYWWRRRTATKNRVLKDVVEENTQVELECVRSVPASLPPAYEEQTPEGRLEDGVSVESGG